MRVTDFVWNVGNCFSGARDHLYGSTLADAMTVLRIMPSLSWLRFESPQALSTIIIVTLGELRIMSRTIPGLALILGVVMSAIPAVFAQSSFSWSAKCHGAIGSGATADWIWTQNGASIASGNGFCNYTLTSNSGSGTVPSNANGIVVLFTVHVDGACSKQVSASQSFSPGTTPSIRLAASCSGTSYGGTVSIKADFILS